MNRGFKRHLTVNIAVTCGVVLVLLTLVFLLGRDIKTQATNIKNIKTAMKTRIQQLNDLTRLREEAKLAEPNLAKLEKRIPSRDELPALRGELEQLAKRNSLIITFGFGAENPKVGNLGNVNLNLKLRGGDGSIRKFINEFETGYPFIRITGLDMVRQEKEFNTTLTGEVLFSD